MQTFTDLYEFLQNYDGDDIIEWLNHRWDGKDKQESLLRLFAGLGLIDKLKAYDICKGNFNLKTITKHTSIKDIFYDGSKIIKLKDKSDKSDLTMLHSNNNKKILAGTSKNRANEKNEGIGKYDIREIHSIFTSMYDNYDELVYCICTKDTKRLEKKIQNCEECNDDIKKYLPFLRRNFNRMVPDTDMRNNSRRSILKEK